MTFSKYFEIKNYLEYPIKLAPDPVEDISKFELNGEVVIPPSPNGRMFPKISLQEEEVIIAHMQKKSVTVNLSELDFSSLGLSTEPFYVQRLQIIDTENEGINYLSDTISSLQVKYKEFNTDINTHFRSLTSKITDAFKLNINIEEEKGTKKEKKETLMKNYSSEYIEQLQQIINIHQQIFNNIKNTFSILNKFLDISKTLSKEKPINEFLSTEFKNIIDNWLYMQIDF